MLSAIALHTHNRLGQMLMGGEAEIKMHTHLQARPSRIRCISKVSSASSLLWPHVLRASAQGTSEQTELATADPDRS